MLIIEHMLEISPQIQGIQYHTNYQDLLQDKSSLAVEVHIDQNPIFSSKIQIKVVIWGMSQVWNAFDCETKLESECHEFLNDIKGIKQFDLDL